MGQLRREEWLEDLLVHLRWDPNTGIAHPEYLALRLLDQFDFNRSSRGVVHLEQRITRVSAFPPQALSVISSCAWARSSV
jgi:hypothetical protein